MFNLENELKKWRNRLNLSEAYKNTDIEELESHLHTEIEKLREKGLTEEEAYLIAIHRLGDTHSLNKEYKKVNSNFIWKKRMLWLLGGYILFYLQTIFSYLLRAFLSSFSKEINDYYLTVGLLSLSVFVQILIIAFTLYFVFSKKLSTYLANKFSGIEEMKNYKKMFILLPALIIMIFQFIGGVIIFFNTFPGQSNTIRFIEQTMSIYLGSLWTLVICLSFSVLFVTIYIRKAKSLHI